VGDVEERGVAVGDARIQRQQCGLGDAGIDRAVDTLEQLDGAARPHAPVPEQAAADAHRDALAAARHHEGLQQVEHDVVVVAGVERDALLGAGGDDTTHHVERAVAVEGRHLHRHHVVDGREALPEGHRQRDAAHRRLQVEADQRHHCGHRRAVRHQFVDRGALHRRQRQHAGVVSMLQRELRLGDGLRRAAGQAGDQDHRALRLVAHRLRGQFQHRAVEAGFADRELRGVHAHRQAAGAGGEVVACQRTLAPRIEPARRVQRQRVRRNHGAAPQQREHLIRQVGPVSGHQGNSLGQSASAAGWPAGPVLY
jgi:hypothetical protein